MQLSRFGQCIRQQWMRLSNRFQDLAIDEFVIMPNHIHGILILGSRGTGASTSENEFSLLPRAPTIERFGQPVAGSIPTIIRSFKASVTYLWRKDFHGDGPCWQRNYYEQVIRDEGHLKQIRAYILGNPLKWDWDRENPSVR